MELRERGAGYMFFFFLKLKLKCHKRVSRAEDQCEINSCALGEGVTFSIETQYTVSFYPYSRGGKIRRKSGVGALLWLAME